MKDRINQIKLREGLTDGQFAEKIGISPASLSHILNGRNKPSLEVVMKIKAACSYVDWDWLVLGIGEMESQPEEKKMEFSINENPIFSPDSQEDSENRKEIASNAPFFTPKEIVREEIKYVEKPARKITEIRIFFDNGTYETFHPDKKD